MIPQLAMTALSGGLSFLSGIGQQQAAAKQNRLQAINDLNAEIRTAERMNDANAKREALGRELLTIEEKERVQSNTSSSNKSASGSVATTTSRSDYDNWNWSETRGDIDMAGFMAAGEKAGFNPVTWLNSGALSLYARSRTEGGSGGWTTGSEVQTQDNWSWSEQKDSSDITTTRTGHNAADAFKMMVPEVVAATSSQVQRVPSSLEVFGNAGQAALSTAKDFYKQDQARDFQTSLLDKQLQALANRGTGGGSGGGLNLTTATGPKVSAGGNTGQVGSLSSTPISKIGLPAGWEYNKTQVTNPFPNVVSDPRSPDAQAVEDRHGDGASFLYGLYSIPNDIVYHATGGVNIPTGLSNLTSGKTFTGDKPAAGSYTPFDLYRDWRKAWDDAK